MNPGPASAAPEAVEPLIEQVEAELRVQRWHLRFQTAVEHRFEADHAAPRAKSLLMAGVAALLVYNLFLINDHLMRPEVFWQAVFWRLGVLTPFGLAVLACVRRGLPPFWREAAMASTVVASVVASSMIVLHTRGNFAAYDLFVMSLIFIAGNILFSLRYVHAVASTLTGFVAAAAFAVAHPDLPREALSSALALMAGTAIFSLLACRRIELESRRAYLLVLREELRTQATMRSAQALAQLSLTDPLTELPNRRAFESRLQTSWTQPDLRSLPRALLMVDIDHFKRYNDHHGHPAGDACLRQVAGGLRANLRQGDLVARLGGEEFAVLMVQASPQDALATVERLRRAVEALGLPHDGQDGRQVVTVSIGLATSAHADQATPTALLEQADQALYQAKRAGRNRWAVAGQDAGAAFDAAPAATAPCT